MSTISHDEMMAQLEEKVAKLKRLIPPPSLPGSYIGDTYYPAGGTEASHRWDGEKWEWIV